MGKKTLKSSSNIPRQYLPNSILVIGGRRNSLQLHSVECYFFKEKQWSNFSEIPDSRVSSGCAVVGDKVYVVGGWKNEDVLSSVFMCDPSGGTWTTTGSRMLCGRSGHGVVALDGRIYALGGVNMKGDELNTAEVMDVATQEWRNIADMNTRRRGVGAGVLNGKVFAVGGHDGERCLSSVECYDPEEDTWSHVGNLTVARYAAGVCVLDGFLYCVGGRSRKRTEKTVERFNPDTNTWSLVAKMNHSRTYAGALSHDGCVYVMGHSG